jgi:hypothetical protein
MPGIFLISDTRVKSSLCLRSFSWPASNARATDGSSFITLRDVIVGTTAAIDLNPAADSAPNGATSMNFANHFDIIGLETSSLIFNFSGFDAGKKSYELSVSGLKFENVYAARTPCDYDPNYFTPDSNDAAELNQQSAGDPRSVLHLPYVKEVMSWLDSNSLATTQPFTAFVDVFQRDGRDSDAKDLRIAKASTELCVKARRVFGDWICRRGLKNAAGPQESADNGSIISYVNALVAVSLGALLWLLADHGFHPEKVGWFVIIAILFFGSLLSG